MNLADKKKVFKEVRVLFRFVLQHGSKIEVLMSETKKEKVDPIPTLRGWFAEIESEDHP